LSGANLHVAYLSGAKLQRANLQEADLHGAYLCKAYLSGASLSGASLSGANLQEANLSGADLREANLSGADLSGADLQGADLSGANLHVAYLSGAKLQRANLREANLHGAYLSGADLHDTKLPNFQIPQESELVVWKKLENNILAKLLVPSEAKRTASLIGRKCRAEYVKVLEIIGEGRPMSETNSYPKVYYNQNEIVRPDKYDDDIRVECSSGIHFFLTREEAENWRR